jgi:hypothetical protein
MLGSIYALIALGYTMVYGILRIINFAHGDILMVGALTTLSGMNALNAHFPTLPPLAQLGLALLLAMAVCALLAMAVERFAYRRLRRPPRLAPLISGIGVSVLLQTVAMIVWSRNPLMFPQILPMDPIAVTRGSSASSGAHYRHRYRHRRAGPRGDARPVAAGGVHPLRSRHARGGGKSAHRHADGGEPQRDYHPHFRHRRRIRRAGWRDDGQQLRQRQLLHGLSARH